MNLPYESRKIKTVQLLQDEAIEVLKLWRSTEDRIEY
jgi:hypothetical protein